MERYVARQSLSLEKPKHRHSPLWDRMATELSGRFPSAYCHGVSRLLLDSYTEARAFGHRYDIGSEHCPTHF
ncbi:hypothetical protein Taro_054296 [Colocasia esculenta]|uniref:Uncharacterized protein n=1 Tax=Colocasia esculenta TaxID=4460 RepID=A0A843XNG3_COLES|nr:hypothetical protein [Colocasia esculenta]